MRLLALPLLLMFVSSCAPTTQATVESIVTDHALKLMGEQGYPALSVAVFEKGQEKRFHFGQMPNGHAPNDEVFFDIGSLTKTHTGLILAQAVIDERVDLDAPIAPFFPDIDAKVFEQDGVKVTIRHLATHVSGLPTDLACDAPDMEASDRLSCFFEHDRADLLQRLQGAELLSKPGTEYRYSNVSVRLLGYMLSDLYGLSFEELLNDVVFAQTGQIETRTLLSKAERLRWAIGQQSNGQVAPNASAYFNAAGGLKSTLPDMGRYMRFYLSGENTLALKATDLLMGDPDGLGRAYVWNTFRLETEGMLYHGGGTFGTSSWMSLYPGERRGIFLVTPYVAADTQEQLNNTANAIVASLRAVEN